jgi:alkylated DNA repair dioxygenase AlkB
MTDQYLYENLQVIEPGLVFLKGALSQEQQLWLAHYAIKAGNREENGFWIRIKNDNGTVTKILNSDSGRGRIYDDIMNFQDPERVVELCNKLVSSARKHDYKMPQMNPTHLLLNYYTSPDGMDYHIDNDINDGKNDHPIVSITIGNSCDFGFKIVAKPHQSLRLESGDVLIWGGPNRMLLHGVDRVHQNTCPDFLKDILGNVRLNFTYRDAPDVRGRESLFKYNLSGFNVGSNIENEA